MAADPIPGALPDLPSPGLSTRRQRELHDNICEFMRQTERERGRLLLIVIEGKEKWRRVCRDIWRGLSITDDLISEIYFYFCLQAAQAYPFIQRALLDNRQNPPKVNELMRDLIPRIELELEGLKLIQKWKP